MKWNCVHERAWHQQVLTNCKEPSFLLFPPFPNPPSWKTEQDLYWTMNVILLIHLKFLQQFPPCQDSSSQCGPQTNSNSSNWEWTRGKFSSSTRELLKARWGPCLPLSHKPARWLWCQLKFENQCLRIKSSLVLKSLPNQFSSIYRTCLLRLLLRRVNLRSSKPAIHFPTEILLTGYILLSVFKYVFCSMQNL